MKHCSVFESRDLSHSRDKKNYGEEFCFESEMIDDSQKVKG